MRRVGGAFFGIFLVTGAVQAVTGVFPEVPSVANAVPAAKSEVKQGYKFTGSSKPIRTGSVPEKEWEKLINKWGNLCKPLKPAILAAQLHQESMGFSRSVIAGNTDSPAGARGISQFMPATWKSHGIDANGDGRRNILDPEDAIPSAAVYDCKVAKSVGHIPGNLTNNMLAGYNAGSGAVQRYGGIPPYRETQTYVRLINNKAGRFEQR
jgi:soluble lytic murein transglycosylase-like protein